jgi:hypothetical protein
MPEQAGRACSKLNSSCLVLTHCGENEAVSLVAATKGWIMSLTERARDGLKEVPSNAAWLLSKVLGPTESAAESAAVKARDQGRRLGAAVVDAAPIGGDLVQTLSRRAREAAERAREAEVDAVETAEEAKARADYAREVSARGRARLNEVERETARHRDERIKQAELAAEEALRREREAAEAEAEKQRSEVFAAVEAERKRAQQEAEAAQQEAEAKVVQARERLVEARRLAEEAAEAARAAAEDANRHAQQLAAEAEQQANDAQARVGAAEQIQRRSEATVTATARELDRSPTNGDLRSYNKQELVELAASMDIAGRSQMTKDELVSAIRRASRGR